MTEIGHNGTENIHLHGIVWTQHDIRNLAEIWQYGYIWDGQKKNENRVNYISERTINYITKYITKTDEKHKTYKPIILTSAGIEGVKQKWEQVKQGWKNLDIAEKQNKINELS